MQTNATATAHVHLVPPFSLFPFSSYPPRNNLNRFHHRPTGVDADETRASTKRSKPCYFPPHLFFHSVKDVQQSCCLRNNNMPFNLILIDTNADISSLRGLSSLLAMYPSSFDSRTTSTLPTFLRFAVTVSMTSQVLGINNASLRGVTTRGTYL